MEQKLVQRCETKVDADAFVLLLLEMESSKKVNPILKQDFKIAYFSFDDFIKERQQ